MPNSTANTKLKQNRCNSTVFQPGLERLPQYIPLFVQKKKSVLAGGSGERGTKQFVRLGQQFLAAV